MTAEQEAHRRAVEAEQESLRQLTRWPVQFSQLGILLVQHLRAHGAAMLWPPRGGEAAFEIVGGMENDPGARRALLNRLYECVMDVPAFLAMAASDTAMAREFDVILREENDPGVWVRETIAAGSKWRTKQ
jgi:hypothetical protein